MIFDLKVPLDQSSFIHSIQWKIQSHLPVDILYGNFFLVRIVEIIVHFVLSMSLIQIYPLHVHVMHYPVILNEKSKVVYQQIE